MDALFPLVPKAFKEPDPPYSRRLASKVNRISDKEDERHRTLRIVRG